MKHLFKSELARFRTWAIAATLVHLAALGYTTRVVDLAQQPKPVYQVFGMVYALAGILLGLYQMMGYRRPSHWLNLLHRPMHRLSIAAGLCGGGATVLAVAIALPILLVAGYQEAFTARVVDLRHWLLPVAAVLIAWCGYLAGAYAALANRRYSAAVVILPVLFMFSQASGAAALAVQAVVLLYLAALVAIVFKPELDTPPRNPLALLAMALPLQVGVYFLLWMLGIGYEIGLTAMGTHPLNGPTTPQGGYIQADRMEPRERMLAGLASSRDPEAPLWREQVALADAYMLYPLRELPRRGQLTGTRQPLEFSDDEHATTWVFSHDRMRFEGRGTRDGVARGELGVGSAQAAFPGPAMPYAESYLVTPSVTYQYDLEQQQVFPRVRLPAGEVFANPPDPAGENLAALSNRALYFYSGREASNSLDPLQPLLRAPIPGEIGKLSGVDLVELLDGYLASFTFSNGAWAGEAVPYQVVLRIDGDGKAREVARRALAYDLPLAYTMRSWWLSPTLREACLAARAMFAAPNPLDAGSIPPPPRNIIVLAGILCLLSLLAAAWLARRYALAPLARWTWVLACGVIGLPALASLWLLYRGREQ
jgi:hypothetical protein